MHAYKRDEKPVRCVELEDFSNLGLSLQNYEVNKYWINSLIDKEYKFQSLILLGFIMLQYSFLFILKFILGIECDYFREVKIFVALTLVIYARQTDLECEK
jgi:hypothetical protein